ncbi:hypothetical protein C0Q70_08113 [Pomacea canaliculata]|uniref:G-protein coupled receptors family 1 profile domain-containing protein n=1 Tax=Pomacea canaliculata TaxID=400727 RepID=A0A2T7PGY2_POMCA|nr:hypothetical protein C0Q70_08113 [Pomacea canaliculata]
MLCLTGVRAAGGGPRRRRQHPQRRRPDSSLDDQLHQLLPDSLGCLRHALLGLQPHSLLPALRRCEEASLAPGPIPSVAYVHWFPYGRVLTDMAANASVLLTVTFTVERYIGVCHPMKGKVLCTPQRAKLFIALVTLLAVVCTVPELFEMERLCHDLIHHLSPQIVWEHDESMNKSIASWQYTGFSVTYGYRIVYYWFLVTAFTFLPLLLLCIFNGILVASLFHAAELRTRMTLTSPRGLSERYAREQQRITKMLITVVLVFILCQLPGAVLLLYDTYNNLARVALSRYSYNELLMAGNVTNLLIQLNASINFLLYSMISTKFRRVFCRTFCERGKAMRPVYRTSTSKSDVIPLSAILLSSFKRSTARSCAPERPGGEGGGGCSDANSVLLPPAEQKNQNGTLGNCGQLRRWNEV